MTNRNVGIKVSVTSVSEVVNVEGQAPILQTDDSSLGQLVDERKIVDLPLNGRDFSQLTYIVPGAYAPRPNSNLGYRGGFSLQGELENTNHPRRQEEAVVPSRRRPCLIDAGGLPPQPDSAQQFPRVVENIAIPDPCRFVRAIP